MCELVLQVQCELQWLYGEVKVCIVFCVGGMDLCLECKVLECGCYIVVGMLGCLCDYIECGVLDLFDVCVVVFDEVDEMFDFGFEEDLEFIFNQFFDGCWILFFLVIVLYGIVCFVKKYQNDVMCLEIVGEKEQYGDIFYQVMMVQVFDCENVIVNILCFNDVQCVIVFCVICEGVSCLVSKLGNCGFFVVVLFGELSQKECSYVFQVMCDGWVWVCIVIDVVVWGIDLLGFELVIYVDLLINVEILKYCFGCIGCVGNKGICVLIVLYSWIGCVCVLLCNGGIEVDWIVLLSVEVILEKDCVCILVDVVLIDEVEFELFEDVKQLFESFGVEQIVVVFICLQMKGMLVFEEFMVVLQFKIKFECDNFQYGGWFKLNIGCKYGVELCWLLLLVCCVGDVIKCEIGLICICEEDSWVEIFVKGLDQFKVGLEVFGGGEKNVCIVQIDEEFLVCEKCFFQECLCWDCDGDGECCECGDCLYCESRDCGECGNWDCDDCNWGECDDCWLDNCDCKDWNDCLCCLCDEECFFDKFCKLCFFRDDCLCDKDCGECCFVDENVLLDELLGDQDNCLVWKDCDNCKLCCDNCLIDGKK